MTCVLSSCRVKLLTSPKWFDTKKAYLDGLETQLKGLVRAMETVAKQRAELSLGLGEFVETVDGLSGTDISNQLASTLQNLAAVQNKAKKLQDDQAQQDAVTFAGTGEGFTPQFHLLFLGGADIDYSS